MVVADDEGRVLWREGSTSVPRRADGLGFEPGAGRREEVVGTNDVGTPAVTQRLTPAAPCRVRAHRARACAPTCSLTLRRIRVVRECAR